MQKTERMIPTILRGYNPARVLLMVALLGAAVILFTTEVTTNRRRRLAFEKGSIQKLREERGQSATPGRKSVKSATVRLPSFKLKDSSCKHWEFQAGSTNSGESCHLAFVTIEKTLKNGNIEVSEEILNIPEAKFGEFKEILRLQARGHLPRDCEKYYVKKQDSPPTAKEFLEQNNLRMTYYGITHKVINTWWHPPKNVRHMKPVIDTGRPEPTKDEYWSNHFDRSIVLAKTKVEKHPKLPKLEKAFRETYNKWKSKST